MTTKVRILLSSIILLMIYLCIKNMIFVDDVSKVKTFKEVKLYQGSFSEIKCTYTSKRDQSIYLIYDIYGEKISFRLGGHKCDTSKFKPEENNTYKIYFIGAKPLSANVGGVVLRNFKEGKKGFNSLFVALISFLLIMFCFIQYWSMKKSQ